MWRRTDWRDPSIPLPNGWSVEVDTPTITDAHQTVRGWLAQDPIHAVILHEEPDLIIFLGWYSIMPYENRPYFTIWRRVDVDPN